MPDWSKEITSFLAGLNLEPAREAEIVEELSQHLNDRYNELVLDGAAPQEAYATALEELSGGKLAAALKPVLRSAASSTALGENGERRNIFSGIWQDLRYSFRQLRFNPGFATIAILSLALGIGANSAIFQLLDSVRLRTLPVKDPQSVADVRIVDNPYGRSGNFSTNNPQLTNPMWEQLRDQQRAFSSIAAWSTQNLNLSQGGEAHYAHALYVSGSFFDVLGIQPVFGRLISPADDRRGCGSPVAVISYSYWQRAFGGHPLADGAKLSLEGHPIEIAGVTPASFYGVEVGRNFDVAIPICAEAILMGEQSRLDNRRAWWLASIGRLKPGWTLERATAQLKAVSPGIFEAVLPKYDEIHTKHFLEFKLGAISAASGVSSLRREYETPLWLLMAISGLVLLIACANLANLMLARASTRRREMAVRLALGASRTRLIRQLLAESLLIAATGALCGVALAQFLSRSLVAFLSTQQTSVFVDLAPDWRVLAFAISLAAITCLLFGLAPALQAASTPPGEAMKASGRGLTANRERFGLRRALVVSQVAISLVLLVGALLFVRTFRNLINEDAGFQQDNVLITNVDLSPLKLPVALRPQYRHDLLTRVRAIPSVLSAASVHAVPLDGGYWNGQISIPRTTVQRAVSFFNQVSPGYFTTLRSPLLAGRDFNSQDTATAPRVAIVTEAFAKKYLDGANPVGKTFDLDPEYGEQVKTFQIIGLVKNSKYDDLRDEFKPIVFTADAQGLNPHDQNTSIVLHSDQDLAALTSSVKRTIAEMDPSIAITFEVFKTTIREGLTRERLMATLSGFFGALAAILAMIGLYGVMSYMVVRRRNEIGIRMALGANRSEILSLVLREAATLLGIGLLCGSVLAVMLATTARSLLYGLKPSDPLTLLIAAAGLATVATLASLIPAQRAAHSHPMDALREE